MSEIESGLESACGGDDPRPAPPFIESIRRHGVLRPILLPTRGGRYLLIAGRKRLAAAIQAGLREVPCMVQRVDEEQAGLLAEATNLPAQDAAVLARATAPAAPGVEAGARGRQPRRRRPRRRGTAGERAGRPDDGHRESHRREGRVDDALRLEQGRPSHLRRGAGVAFGPPSWVDRTFDAVWPIAATAAGTLALQSARRIGELHGGTATAIAIQSGTSFNLTLPLAAREIQIVTILKFALAISGR